MEVGKKKEKKNIPVAAVGVAKQGGAAAQAGQDLDGVDPEAGADEETRDVLAAADVWERSGQSQSVGRSSQVVCRVEEKKKSA